MLQHGSPTTALQCGHGTSATQASQRMYRPRSLGTFTKMKLGARLSHATIEMTGFWQAVGATLALRSVIFFEGIAHLLVGYTGRALIALAQMFRQFACLQQRLHVV